MRSQLFVPADSEKMLAKATQSGADCLILDLEDSLTADRKPQGRKTALAFMKERRPPGQQIYVRINPLGSGMALQDLAAVMAGAPDGIMLPKCRSGADVRELDHYLSALEAREGLPQGQTKILPIVTEVAGGLFTMSSYQDCGPRLMGMMWGAEDLSADLGASIKRLPDGAYDDPYRLARTVTLLGAKAAGVIPFDTVFIDFKDLAGLETECLAARQAGFLAKPAIHPAQVETINRAFSVALDEVEWARKVVRAFADNPSSGVVGLDGVMLDRPHLRQAETLLARAEEQSRQPE
ncbi:MAG: CoA ester lyase [SAR324 cluster bacterium]|nr:CoA ester lyase [SAR324 cluster bacterium]